MDAFLMARRTLTSIVEALAWLAAFAAVLAGFAVIIGSGGEFVLHGGLLVLVGPVAAHVCGRTLILLVHAERTLGDVRRALARG